MAKRKATPKKKIRRKSSNNNLFQSSLAKVLAGVSILVLLVVTAGLLMHFLVSPDKPSKSVSPVKSVPPTPQTSAKSPTFEIYPSKEVPPVKKPAKSATPERKLPLVAIIIDDLGYDKK